MAPAERPRRYQDLRVLMVRDNWFGNTGLSAFDAALRLGVWVSHVSEFDYLPLLYRRVSSRAVAKLLRSVGIREFNDALTREAELLRPHLFFAVKGTFVDPSVLRHLRAQGVVCFNFFPDNSISAFGPRLQEAMLQYDWVFASKGFIPADLQRQYGFQKSSYLPHAADPLVHHRREVSGPMREKFACDVTFVGNWTAGKQQLLEHLVRLRPRLNLKVLGPNWERVPAGSVLRPFVTPGPVVGLSYSVALSSAKIALGLVRERLAGASSADTTTMRTFEIPACGTAMLHERTPDLLQIFKEDESCACFEGVEELAAKIDGLLADDARRERIAQAGQAVVLAGHTWDHRMRTILDRYLQDFAGPKAP